MDFWKICEPLLLSITEINVSFQDGEYICAQMMYMIIIAHNHTSGHFC